MLHLLLGNKTEHVFLWAFNPFPMTIHGWGILYAFQKLVQRYKLLTIPTNYLLIIQTIVNFFLIIVNYI